MNNSSNVGRAEKASQWENTGWDLERIRKTQKVKENSLKGVLSSWAEQDWIIKWGKGDLHLKKYSVSKFLEISPTGTAGDKTKPPVFVYPALSQTQSWPFTLLSYHTNVHTKCLRKDVPSSKDKKHGRKSRYRYQSPLLGCLKVLTVLEFIPGPCGWLAVVALVLGSSPVTPQGDRVNSGVWACCFLHGFTTHQHFILPRATAAKGLGSHFFLPECSHSLGQHCSAQWPRAALCLPDFLCLVGFPDMWHCFDACRSSFALQAGGHVEGFFKASSMPAPC